MRMSYLSSPIATGLECLRSASCRNSRSCRWCYVIGPVLGGHGGRFDLIHPAGFRSRSRLHRTREFLHRRDLLRGLFFFLSLERRYFATWCQSQECLHESIIETLVLCQKRLSRKKNQQICFWILLFHHDKLKTENNVRNLKRWRKLESRKWKIARTSSGSL